MDTELITIQYDTLKEQLDKPIESISELSQKDMPCIVIVQPETIGLYSVKHLPFGPLFLAPKLKKAGFMVLIYDQRVDSKAKLDDILENNNVVLMTFSVFTGPTIITSLALAKEVRSKYKHIKFVFGGPHPMIAPVQTCQHSLVDFVSTGDGEVLLVELMDTLINNKDFKNINGLVFKDENNNVIVNPPRKFLKMDDDVTMALDLIDINKYIFEHEGLKTIHLLLSRGCPYRCNFCWQTIVNKRQWRKWSIERVEQEIKPFIDAGVKRIVLQDDLVGDEKRVLELGRLFRRLGVKEWAMENGCRVDLLKSEEFFKELKELNCTHTSYGAESGSQEILNSIDKDITPEMMLHVARMGKKYGIGIKFSWMLGLPNETKEQALETLALIDKIKKIAPDTSCAMSLFAPYPGTPMYQKAMENGWKPPQSFEEWGIFREEAIYPYLGNWRWYKAIILSAYFIAAGDTKYIIWKKVDWKLRPFYKLLYFTASLRWKTRFFSFPVEYYLVQFLWDMKKKLVIKGIFAKIKDLSRRFMYPFRITTPYPV